MGRLRGSDVVQQELEEASYVVHLEDSPIQETSAKSEKGQKEPKQDFLFIRLLC